MTRILTYRDRNTPEAALRAVLAMTPDGRPGQARLAIEVATVMVARQSGNLTNNK